MTTVSPPLTRAEMARRLRQMEDGRHFAAILRTIAGACQLTDAELADRAGVSRQTTSAKKLGRKKIYADEVEMWARALQVPEEIFYIEDVGEALAEATRWLEWDSSAHALRGVHESSQYSPTARNLFNLALSAA